MLQRRYEMTGDLVEVRFVQSHGEESIVLGEHVLLHVDILGNARKRHLHEFALMLLQHVQWDAHEESFQIVIDHDPRVEFVHRSRNRPLPSQSIEQRLILRLLLLLLLGVLIGPGGPLLEDGTEGRHHSHGLVDLALLHPQGVEGAHEVSRHGVEVSLVQPHREQPFVLRMHEFHHVDRCGDLGEGHAEEFALMLLEIVHADPLEESRERLVLHQTIVEFVHRRVEGPVPPQSTQQLTFVRGVLLLRGGGGPFGPLYEDGTEGTHHPDRLVDLGRTDSQSLERPHEMSGDRIEMFRVQSPQE
mmetsp:Transcript_8138/g.24319  ORF Transcript_8138/g.24319 Transcript_8138/m.24319 type:complete len:302 (+) Transcript_8138:557-1462(+)